MRVPHSNTGCCRNARVRCERMTRESACDDEWEVLQLQCKFAVCSIVAMDCALLLFVCFPAHDFEGMDSTDQVVTLFNCSLLDSSN